MKILFALTGALLASATLHAAESDRFITKVKLPSGQTAVVAEGDFEARSIGSFSVRLYEAAPSGDETTFFTAGLIRARDGSIETVLLADVDGNKRPEIIVNVRSVGTGSYLSAQPFGNPSARGSDRTAQPPSQPDSPQAALAGALRVFCHAWPVRFFRRKTSAADSTGKRQGPLSCCRR